jgi:hypothetical protein
MRLTPQIALICLVFAGCAATPAAQNEPVAPGVAAYAGDVDVTDWGTYHSAELGFEVRYPHTFEVQENSGKVTFREIGEGTTDTIVFAKVRSTIKEQVGHIFRGAHRIEHEGLKIKDPDIRAAIAYFQSGDAHSWFMTYFLLRNSDYPETTETVQNQPYDIIVAEVKAFPTDDEMVQARAAGLETGPAGMLSAPQQILSTFHFF